MIFTRLNPLCRQVDMLCVLLPRSTLPPSLLTLALVRRPYDAVGGLPGLVVVERGAALAVVASCVVSAHALPVDLPGKRHGQSFFFFGGGSGRFKAPRLSAVPRLTFRCSVITFCVYASCSHPTVYRDVCYSVRRPQH